MYLMTVDDAAYFAGVKSIVYGESGAGKTMLCSTMPAPILINAEGGVLSLTKSNILRVHPEGTWGVSYDIPVLTISSFAEIDDVLRWLQSSQEATQYASVYIDSLSELGEIVLAEAKKKNRDLRMAYSDTMVRVEKMVRDFRDLRGKHVTMACKMTADENLKCLPALPGSKLSKRLPYFFDEVFYIGVGESGGQQFRYLRTKDDGKHVAKDRSGALAEIEPAHMGHVIAKIWPQYSA